MYAMRTGGLVDVPYSRGMSPRVAALLAAGGGARFQGPTHKLLAPLHGRPVWEHSLAHVMAAGFDHVVFVIRRQIEKEFKAAIGSRFEEQIDVDYAFQELDAPRRVETVWRPATEVLRDEQAYVLRFDLPGVPETMPAADRLRP